MQLSRHLAPELPREAASFLACVATVLELAPAALPALAEDEDPATGWTIARWLGGLGLGLARLSAPQSFTWPGPWIARVQPPAGDARFVVMYGVPSGVVWDPAGQRDGDGDGDGDDDGDGDGDGDDEIESEWLTDGFLIAATDIALARPPLPEAPPGAGSVERIWIAARAGAPAVAVEYVQALAGRGLEGDRHVAGTGTFPSGLPGSALTLVEAEVCESFTPSLEPDEHRRNVITRGVALNRLVGHEFTVGGVRCRGARLCEPCTVVQRYAGRPVLRELVHRGGLRADILEDGVIRVGDMVRAVQVASRD